MKLEEKFVKNLYKREGKILTFRDDEVVCPDGTHSTREVIDHNGGVCVAPILDDGRIIFIRQFRYAYGEVVTELPAGKLEKGEQSDPEAAGRRELKEETGYTAESMRFMGKFYPSCGYTNEIIYLYAAPVRSAGEQELDDDEFIEPVTLTLEQAVEKIMSGEIKDGKTIALILKINEMVSRH